jgi:hypothetical protein
MSSRFIKHCVGKSRDVWINASVWFDIYGDGDETDMISTSLARSTCSPSRMSTEELVVGQRQLRRLKR